MSRLPSILIRCALLLLLGASAVAQPDAEQLVRTWIVEQVAAVETSPPLRMSEESFLRIDHPRGARETRFRSQLTTSSGSARWTRSVTDASVNGRALEPDEFDRLDAWLGRRSGLPLLEVVMSPEHLLRSLRVVDTVVESEVEGRPAWRVELIPERSARGVRPPPPPFRSPGGFGPSSGRMDPSRFVERVTLWFTPTAEPRLLQLRLMLRPPHAAGPTLVTAAYVQFEHLDLPYRVEAEGVLTQQRRGRGFTAFLEAVLSFTDHGYLSADPGR